MGRRKPKSERVKVRFCLKVSTEVEIEMSSEEADDCFLALDDGVPLPDEIQRKLEDELPRALDQSDEPEIDDAYVAG